MPSLTVADEDNDGFGEFKFISSPLHNNNINHGGGGGDDDDGDDVDWGDFVQSPQTHSNSNSINHWEKPKGAIPLSIFGVIEEDEQEEESPDTTQFSYNNSSSSINGNGFSFLTHAKPRGEGKDLDDDGIQVHVESILVSRGGDYSIHEDSSLDGQAENGLGATIKPFEHASLKEQEAYIATWSRIAHACAKELHHGAMIWKESVDANVSEEILSRGRSYFAALVEIFGVTQILRASLKLHKAWMLSTPEHSSRELTSSLEKCVEAWTASGMGKTLESIFAATTSDLGHLLSDVDDDSSFQNHAFKHGSVICRLSLLPVDMLQGVKVVKWDGHHYCLRLANFWANRVSCCPPQLPS